MEKIRMAIMHRSLKPALLMVMVEVVFASGNVLYKVAASHGMNLSVLIFYRFLFATAFIAPIAFFVERSKRPKLTWKVLLLAFLCGLFGGSLGQNLYIQSLVYTSATYVTAIFNLVPAITLIVAVTLRLEKLGWNTPAGNAKVLGTIIGIGGATLLTFYKGPEFHLWKPNIHLLHTSPQHNLQTKPLLGSILALLSCFCYSLWLICQAKAIKQYPCPYSLTALTKVMGTFQAFVYAISRERDQSQWKLGWNVRLLATTFTGIVASAMMYVVVAWCVHMKGPVYVSAFNPLWLIIMAIAGYLFLEERIFLGTFLGGGLIVVGLYIVLLGKDKETSQIDPLKSESSTKDRVRFNEIDIHSPTATKDGS